MQRQDGQWEGCDGLWMAQLPNLSEQTASDPIKRLSTLNPLKENSPTPCWCEADIWRWFLLVWVTLRLLQRILAVTTWWRFVLRTSTAAIIPFLAMSSNALGTAYQHLHRSHPHPLLPLPYLTCHVICSAWELPAVVLETLEEGGLVGTWALSLPVGYCPSEGFPASSNSQDWQQFLIPPFAFLAITMVCKASCSGHFASCF